MLNNFLSFINKRLFKEDAVKYFKVRKSLAVAQYLISYSKETYDIDLTPIKLLKLSYIAHGYMLAAYGKPLLDELVCAWKYGPIVKSIYCNVRNYRNNPVTKISGKTQYEFTINEKEIMKGVVDKYAKVDEIILSTAMHGKETPWFITWNLRKCNQFIPNDIIKRHYKNIISQPSHTYL